MSKKEALSYIKSAKASHIEWRSNVQGYVSGMHIDASKLPLIHTNCIFAQWYYTEGQIFTHLSSYKAINLLLEDVFEKYRSLYRALHTPTKKAGLFQSQDKIETKRTDKINSLMQEVFNSSQKLIQATTTLEHDIKLLSDEEFDNLF